MKNNGWIPLSEEEPTKEQIEKGVWWCKEGWEKPVWRNHGGSGDSPFYKHSWYWRPDPLCPPVPVSKCDQAFNTWSFHNQKPESFRQIWQAAWKEAFEEGRRVESLTQQNKTF